MIIMFMVIMLLTEMPDASRPDLPDEVVILPLFGDRSKLDVLTNQEDPRELTESKTVRLADERWICSTRYDEEQGPPVLHLGLQLRDESRMTRWDVESAFSVTLTPGDVLPILDHLYRYEDSPNRGLVFRDVTAIAPREIVPARGDVCILNNDYRLNVRAKRMDGDDPRYIGASVETDGPTRAKAWVHIRVGTIDELTPRQAGRPVKLGEVLNIAEGVNLKLVRTVAPRQIAGVGRLIGWTCFEDPFNAAELAKNADFHKQRKERERTAPPYVSPRHLSTPGVK